MRLIINVVIAIVVFVVLNWLFTWLNVRFIGLPGIVPTIIALVLAFGEFFVVNRGRRRR